MEAFWQDVKFGLRMLVKNPGFTVVAVLTLALGIGANTAVFSVVNALLLRPLPVKDPEQLMVLAVTHAENREPHPLAYLDFEDYRKNSQAFSDMAGYFADLESMSAEGRAERIAVCYVTPNYFSLLGVNAARGRVIRPDEGWEPGTGPVIVLGHAYWMKRFGGDAGILGKTVSVNSRAVTVIGVAPEWFHGTYTLIEFDAYMPLGMSAFSPEYAAVLGKRDEHQMHTLARLKPGFTRKQAQASLDVIARQLQAQYPDTNKTVEVHVIPEPLARPEPSSGSQNPIVATIFLSLTALVLLVACVNVANLLLVRATLRHKEIAIRAALGAGQGRLIRHLLTESVLLALFGGLAGVLVGAWLSRMLSAIRLPGDIPIRFDFSLDWRVFGYSAAIALVTGVVVGLLPALRAARADLNDALREGGRSMAAGAGGHRMRDLLVVAQVSVTLVLLIAAGLFVRSLGNAQSVDLGFEPRGVLDFSLDPGQQGYDEVRGKEFFRQVVERVRALPGVESASFAYSVPMGYYSLSEYLTVEGRVPAPGEPRPVGSYNAVGADYFRTMRIPVIRGRGFTAEDTADSRSVAVINERMATELWPGQDPLGRRFSMSGPEGPYLEVVGLTRTGKYQWLFEDPRAYFYVPLAQKYQSARVLQVRTSLAPETLALTIQQIIRELDPDLPVYDVMTMEQALQGGNGFFLIRMGAMFAGALGLLGLALAIVGVYGVVSYAASQRTHEIGIRMALGAQPGNILRLIVGQGLKLILVGVAAGLALSFGLSRFVSNLLFGISSSDPVTFLGVPGLLGAVAIAACWIPARRAARVDPMVALRYE